MVMEFMLFLHIDVEGQFKSFNFRSVHHYLKCNFVMAHQQSVVKSCVRIDILGEEVINTTIDLKSCHRQADFCPLTQLLIPDDMHVKIPARVLILEVNIGFHVQDVVQDSSLDIRLCHQTFPFVIID